MKNGLWISIKSFVFFKGKFVVQKISIYNRNIHKKMLKSYVEMKFEILRFEILFCNIQYLEFIDINIIENN